MSIFEIIECIFIEPLKLFFEVVFVISNKVIRHPGLSIISLSLIMNILVLPLYRQADRMQEQARDTDAKLREGVNHIKKVFSGDERMMILQTYYRQNHYAPTDSLKGSVSLLLEIPFFVAAYRFLSHLEMLEGVSLWAIRDLSKPDGLITIGDLSINLLPILMTVINMVSSFLYLRGFPGKTKVQLYGMALFFLVFLYRSPSGLVFYWTLNNVFSLAKTVCYKLKNAGQILAALAFLIGIPLLGYSLFFFDAPALRHRMVLVAVSLCMQLPMLWRLARSFLSLPNKKNKEERKPCPGQFFLCSVFLAVLTGVLIPSAFISASPQDYVDVSSFYHPLWYIVGSSAMAAGTFLVWLLVFYRLANAGWRVCFDKLVWVLCGVAITDYMFFGTKLGIISSALQYEKGVRFTLGERLLNIAVLACIALAMYVVVSKWRRLVMPVLLAATLTAGAMSAINIASVRTSLSGVEAKTEQISEEPGFRLSSNGRNVVVIMLDRAMGGYIPYLMKEKPELAEKFDGFTYYSNTISYGGYTVFGSNAMLGGYEYTPVEWNRRDTESNVSKHNEAIRVMPVLFSESGYEVTVFDPPYCNYESIPDLNFFDDWPDIKACSTKGVFGDSGLKTQAIKNYHRRFFCLSIMKSSPLLLQSLLYANGSYNQAVSASTVGYFGQTMTGRSLARGIDADFMDEYSALCSMSEMTEVTEEETNTFLYFGNETTHNPSLLVEPFYTPSWDINNMWFDRENDDRFTVDGRSIDMSDQVQMAHYHVNMAALLKLGEWFDYLRANDVYDNTRIIIVSDHGIALDQLGELVLSDDTGSKKDMEYYFPLLLVKDFGSTGFRSSDEFMTNADVPTLAVQDLFENPVNPFTGVRISNEEKNAHKQYIILSNRWKLSENTGNTFWASAWACIQDDLWDRDQWEFCEDEIILKEHFFP